MIAFDTTNWFALWWRTTLRKWVGWAALFCSPFIAYSGGQKSLPTLLGLSFEFYFTVGILVNQ